MLLILGQGQSNPLQAATAYQASQFPPSVTMWNNGQGVDTLDNLGDGWIDPSLSPWGNTMMPHACRRIADVTGSDIRLILNAKGSTAITAWAEINISDPVGPEYPSHAYAMHNRLVAIMARASVSYFNGELWHQAESDINAVGYYYRRWWGYTHLKMAQGILDENSPIGIGEVANIPTQAAILAVQRTLPNYNPHVLTGIAPLANLPTVTPSTPPSPHFTAESVVLAGIRMADTIIPRLQGLIARGLVSIP